jgi:hypothetical protein
VLAPVSELLVPSGDRVEQSVVTFANGRWYVAWGATEAKNTFLQRFTAEGAIEGDALRIEGTLPNALTSAGHGGGQVILSGWVWPGYTPAGSRISIHRLTPDLAGAGPPLLLGGAHAMALDRSIEAEGAGTLVWTDVLNRPVVLAREVRLPPGVGANRPVASRDWRVGGDRDGKFARVGGERYFMDVAEGALRIRRLLDDGQIGPVQRVIEVPTGEGRQILLSEQVGTRWYVGAFAVWRDSPVRVQALDARSLAPVGRLIEIRWPGQRPWFLVDANSTPMLVGVLQSEGGPRHVSLVALDAAAGTVCPANAPVLPSLPGHSAVIRAVHFEGGIGGMTVSAQANSRATRAFFMRLRCLSRCPRPRG